MSWYSRELDKGFAGMIANTAIRNCDSYAVEEEKGLNPGDAVKVESKFITGWFRVEAIRHTGDISSNEWYSEIDLIERLTYI